MSNGKKTRNLESSAQRVATKSAAFPPDAWDPQSASKAQPSLAKVHVDADIRSIQGRAQTAHPTPPTEAEAREFLCNRFATRGYQLETDYHLKLPSLVVRLDGYDPARKVGFVYVSHSDSDVVSDFGEEEERKLTQLDKDGTAHVLVIHDTDIPTEVQLEAKTETFLTRLYEARG